MMAGHSTVGGKPVTPKGEPNTEAMDKWVQNLFKFKNFYDHMDFIP